MFRLAVTALFIQLCGCNASTRNAPGPDSEPGPEPSVTWPGPAAPGGTATQPAPSQPTEPSPAACRMMPTGVRLRINAGQALPTGTGLEIANEGGSHDNFGPGGFDFNISLVFRRDGDEKRHLASLRDRQTHEIFGHCYRLLDGDMGVVLLEVSALPAPPPEQPVPTPSASSATPPVTPTGLVGAGAATGGHCTITDDNGPLPGGKHVTHGCAANEICLCEARAGYSCSGRCAPVGGSEKK